MKRQIFILCLCLCFCISCEYKAQQQEQTQEEIQEETTQENFNIEGSSNTEESSNTEGRTFYTSRRNFPPITSSDDNFDWSGTTIVRYHGTNKDVVIPEGCTGIGYGAFIYRNGAMGYIYGDDMEFCEEIESITIPASVLSLVEKMSKGGGNPFFSCVNLENIYVAEDNPNYSSEDGILYDKDKTKYICYPYKRQGETLILRDTITQIGVYPFSFNAKDEIIKTIYISDKTILDFNTLGYFSSLEDIEISDTNPNYINEDGVLFDKDKKTLLRFRKKEKVSEYVVPESVLRIEKGEFNYSSYALDTVILPEGLQEIGEYALTGIKCTKIPGSIKKVDDFFSQTTLIEKIILSEGVETIGDKTFNWCKNLRYIVLPESLKEIGENVFRKCFYQIIVIPKNVETIKNGAFSENNRLEYIIVKGKTKNEFQKLLYDSDYNKRSNQTKVNIYTGIDVSINGTKVDFDYTSPFVGDWGKIRIPIQYILDAYLIQYRLDDRELVCITEDNEEVLISFDKDEALEIEDILYCSIDKLKEIMGIYGASVKYNKKNYMINIVDNV